jgi:hypothetical protein
LDILFNFFTNLSQRVPKHIYNTTWWRKIKSKMKKYSHSNKANGQAACSELIPDVTAPELAEALAVWLLGMH